MTILYIIGNGFDLWHGLPTSYGKFYEYAKDTLDDAERYFDPGDIGRPWSDFESSLGTYDWQEPFDEWNFHSRRLLYNTAVCLQRINEHIPT